MILRKRIQGKLCVAEGRAQRKRDYAFRVNHQIRCLKGAALQIDDFVSGYITAFIICNHGILKVAEAKGKKLGAVSKILPGLAL